MMIAGVDDCRCCPYAFLFAAPPPSLRYVPEAEQVRVQALSSIQTEEAAIHQLVQRYGEHVTVKILPPR